MFTKNNRTNDQGETMKRLILAAILLAILPATVQGQACQRCQTGVPSSVFVEQQVQHTVFEPVIFEPVIYETTEMVRYTRARSEAISFECIGVAIDAFIANGGGQNWSVSLPAAFEAYRQCNGGSLNVRQALAIRREIRKRGDGRLLNRVANRPVMQPVKAVRPFLGRLFPRLKARRSMSHGMH